MQLEACLVCGSSVGVRCCSHCRVICYCSEQCQLQDWAHHRELCDEMRAARKELAIRPCKHSRLPKTQTNNGIVTVVSEADMERLCYNLQHDIPAVLDHRTGRVTVMVDMESVAKGPLRLLEVETGQPVMTMTQLTAYLDEF
eukprot:gnl/Hemi2/26747_TR8997_c0_g1_i1.p1 gnl/Hemi2/26747_TR8997_c0_g1~~gnl/Hemi2/26747_TR8997_c0_g1_i1.p1  ORF type:complete len:142 (+),score=44.60 gnl/Hemi2/26747_TR8997_c0_g1_i1:140-565(+)